MFVRLAAIIKQGSPSHLSPNMTAMVLRRDAMPPAICQAGSYTYSHCPYDLERSCLVEYQPREAAASAPELPRGTLHPMLRGHVCFVPFEADEGLGAATGAAPEQATTRVFIGQLPFDVSAARIQWMCQAVAGCAVASPQRIVRTVCGVRQPTGGVHVFCDEQQLAVLQQNLHKRVLVDDTGLWFAATAAQKICLDSYVAYLHANRDARRAGRPYDSVVVQRATSSFAGRHPRTA
jgi:hypothetical protein